MRYLLLIYSDPKVYPSLPPEQQKSVLNAWFKYAGELEQAGKSQGGEALQGTDTATTVRLAGGNRLVSDGPFAATKGSLKNNFR